MKILLISVNRERSPYPVFPLGLAYLAGPLAMAGHSLELLDLCFEPDPVAAVAAAIERFAPAAVILSIRNIDNVTYPGSRSYLDGVREVVTACGGHAPVILGGSGFSIMPREVLAAVGGDFGVVGEGEEVLPRLLAALAQGEDVGLLPGVLVRGKDGHVLPHPVQLIGTPDRQLFSVERYSREGGMANLQTKRGCPFSCIYCTYPLLEGSRMRLRPIPDIIAEIRALRDGYGVSYLYFVDDIFNYPMDFAADLCRAMVAAELNVNWSAFINPGFVTPALLEAMVAAGCDAVEFGTEAGSPVMLRNLGKSFGVAEVRDASRFCRDLGVDFAHYILFGGPGECEATVRETFALMDEAGPTAVIAMTGIRIFPGTPLHRQALEEGVITPETSLLEPVFYLSAAIRDTLCDLVTEEAMKRKNWVAAGLEINISDAMLDALRHFPVRGPLWKLMKRLGKSRVKPM
ncbi:lipid biosynthesis B12-binding/radical SAM protein [Geobacter sp. AOG1]|uniref:lipid biosynthesis B12-binding/radical SAM protein n=1 Tax=Geobacter sp. AOG1 TaxID=1566346 RepID=UPI001CC34FC7|nr:lipid biosynthesis B12-binding/radical SAM protein [Geobacter sp. AOG1]GFE56348.1 B12-binding domain-containing radical SAM protein [Geobacter sp. AOG1]